MSQINIQNLLQVGESTELGRVSPQAPQYRQSSFQGGQIQLGQAAQNIGPSAEESMYGALAEIAGSIAKGIDIFGNIRSIEEKKVIADAKNKFKEIYTAEYSENPLNGELNSTQFKTPEEKLNAWNAYIKDTWTPLMGDDWITELNMDAYTSFGSREAQDKFEEGRYTREALDFFNRPEHKFTLNPNSAHARVVFDTAYNSKYPSASGNGWFKATSQKNSADLQTETDNIALQGLQDGLSNILQIPSDEAINAIAAGGTAESEQLKEVFSPFYNEILPAISSAKNEREVATALHAFYVKNLITDNPNQYQPHTLMVLSKELPRIAANQAPQILRLKSTIGLLERAKSAQAQMMQGLVTLGSPGSYNSAIKPFFQKGLTNLPYMGVPENEQPNYVLTLIDQIRKSGYDSSSQTLKVPIRDASPVDREIYGPIIAVFPSVQRVLEQEGSNLTGLTPVEQFEAITGMVLADTLRFNSENAKLLFKLYGATTLEEFLPRFRTAVTSYVLTNKDLNEANQAYQNDQKDKLERVLNVAVVNSNPQAIQETTSLFVSHLADTVKLPSELFQSIYSTTDNGVVKLDPLFDVDKWYASLTPENKKIVEKSRIFFVDKKKLQEAAKQAFDVTLKTTERITQIREEADKQLKDITEDAAKQIEQELKFAQDYMKEAVRFATDRENGTSENTLGDTSTALLTGTIRKNDQSEKFSTLIVAYTQALDVLDTIPKKDGKPDLDKATDVQKMLLEPLFQIERWKTSGNLEMMAAARNVEANYYNIQETIAQAESFAPAWHRMQRGFLGDNYNQEAEQKRFDVNLKKFRQELLTFSLPAYDGNFQTKDALDESGLGLSDKAFSWLLRTELITYRLATSNIPLHEGTSDSERYGKIVENLTGAIATNNDPFAFTDNPGNIVPYLGFVIIGKNVKRGLDEGFPATNVGRAGWFVDRLAMMANASVGVDFEKAGPYFTSPEFRLQANYVADFPFILSSYMRGTDNNPFSLYAQSAAADQLTILKGLKDSSVMLGTAAVTQPSFENLQIIDTETRQKIIDGNENISDADFETLMGGVVEGRTISPADPQWSPELALALWKKAGIIDPNMTMAKFADTIGRRLLDGSTLPLGSNEEIVRAAFSVIERMEASQDRLFSNILTMALDESTGIGSQAFPLPTGRTKLEDILEFTMAGAGIYAAYQTSAMTDSTGVNVQYNDSYANNTSIQLSTDGRMGTLYSIKGTERDNTYTIKSVVGAATKMQKDRPLTIESEGRFKPVRNVQKQTQEDGPLYIAGSRLLQAKPNNENMLSLLRPLMEETDFNSSVVFAITESIEGSKTVFDALVKVDQRLRELSKEKPGIPFLIRPDQLYRRTPNGFSTDLKEGIATLTQQIALQSPQQMAYTLPWINRGTGNAPLLHIEDRIWEMPLDANYSVEELKARQDKKDKEERLRKIEAFNPYRGGGGI